MSPFLVSLRGHCESMRYKHRLFTVCNLFWNQIGFAAWYLARFLVSWPFILANHGCGGLVISNKNSVRELLQRPLSERSILFDQTSVVWKSSPNNVVILAGRKGYFAVIESRPPIHSRLHPCGFPGQHVGSRGLVHCGGQAAKERHDLPHHQRNLESSPLGRDGWVLPPAMT